MNVQNPSLRTKPRPAGERHPARLHVRLRQRLRDRGAARRAADRPQLAAEMRLRPLCRAAHRLALHRAAHHQRALLALPHPADRRPTGASSRRRTPACGAPRPRRGRGADRAHALGPDPDSRTSRSPSRGHPHHHHGGRCAARRPAWARTSTSSPAPWRTSTSTMPTASCCSCRSRATLRLWTEFGIIDIEPGEIAVIPRGVKFRVELTDGPARGYRLRELRRRLHAARARPDRRQLPRQSARLPDAGRRLRGQRRAARRCIVKWGGTLWATEIDHSPLDVVAWHGNYAPYKYDLRRFSPVGPILLRPSRPVDLHGADLAVRDARARPTSTS